MDFYGAFCSIIERREDEYVFENLCMSYGINYVFYKENTKFSELDNFYYV